LIALELAQARQRAAQAQWRIADIVRTAPPRAALRGALRVIGQRVASPRALAVVVAPSVAVSHPQT
jgi:hypothetical protein